jgi:hypothetical protein
VGKCCAFCGIERLPYGENATQFYTFDYGDRSYYACSNDYHLVMRRLDRGNATPLPALFGQAESSGNAIKRKVMKTKEQTEKLFDSFTISDTPSDAVIKALAASTDLSFTVVRQWFYDKRITVKKKAKRLEETGGVTFRYDKRDVETMETFYVNTKFPSADQKKGLAKNTQLTVVQVESWFVLRRRKDRVEL